MKKAVFFLVLFLLMIALAACGGQSNEVAYYEYIPELVEEPGAEACDENIIEEGLTGPGEDVSQAAIHYENLAKLGKVWGFAKYTHHSFITGAKCWDAELLRLIPIIHSAHPADVNGILYEWLIGLDDDGYDFEYGHETFPNSTMATMQDAQYLRAAVDLAWINSDFLGEPLAARLLRFNGITTTDRSNAPVFFDGIGNSVFANQDSHEHMNFGDIDYRLLGLFRMWNAMLYFYPNMDIIDYCWSASLLEFIPIMLEGTSRVDYINTLISLARRLDDAHVFIGERSTHALEWFNFHEITSSHVLLENNIGLINPLDGLFSWGETRYIMEAFADTAGLIIDLRQYPCFSIVYELAEYLVEEPTRFVMISSPHQSFPGSFVYSPPTGLCSGGITSPYAFFYDRPVVILMNRGTMSRGEFAVMSLRNGRNVTVMGSNSIGANGNVAFLPLPGGERMMFTGLGIFTPDGGQTHRIGLAPDIRIVPARGTGDDRDVLIEAAIRHILGE